MGSDLLFYAFVGFLAQLVDGALGMAFGVISTSVLLAMGVTPAVASAGVHAAEVVTTGISGLSHLWFKNVDKKLFVKLAVAGALGGITGAYILTELPVEIIKPIVTVYLCVMGLLIIYRAIKNAPPKAEVKGIAPLGLFGGFLDALGGGGWGPIVTSTLIARGVSPRHVIGSVNLAEFFITVSVSVTFFFTIAPNYFQVAAALIAGGALAAPLAGYMSKTLPPRILMFLVSAIVLTLGAWNLAQLIF
jgi:uncharacterized membrane protein YfcA